MDVRQKLEILSAAARYDASCASSGAGARGAPRGKTAKANDTAAAGIGSTHRCGVCHSFTPDGRCISLLKILFTNQCVFDCLYCANRVSADVPRARFSVEEVVWLTLEFYRRNYIEGLFLSSGIVQSPDHTMAQLAEIARSLREDHQFYGYIHLKAIPGAASELIDLAGRYADRLSANIELPTSEDLQRLAPQKKRQVIEGAMGWIRGRTDESRDEQRRSRRSRRFVPAGQSTQMVIGASPSSDATILATSDHLYRRYRLRRVYYSAFSPVSDDARLPNRPAPLVREHRLYQADWLMRFYGFEAGELTTADAENLPIDIDPKLAWALRHREQFPVDVNRAPRELLLRVPGLGIKSVNKIIAIRRYRQLRLVDLAKLRLVLKWARPFLLVADDNPAVRLLDGPRWAEHFRPVQQRLLFE